MLTDTTYKLFVLHKIKGVGPSTLEKLALRPDFASSTIDGLAKTNTMLAKALNTGQSWDAASALADADIRRAAKIQARIISVLDEEYPRLLRQTKDRPFFLYVRGSWPTQPMRSIAVIGTREPTEHGKVIAQRITEHMASIGWSIVSGLALGCDSIAHRAALSQKGHTVAILAHGLHTVAPKQHEALARQIVDEGGILVTEYGFGVEPFPHQFVKRDRIQAGLTRGVVMIQSGLEGGSLHASRAALEYGRVLAVPVATERDSGHDEKRVAANILLGGTDDGAKARLLKCNASDLTRLFLINNKNDYPCLIDAFTRNFANAANSALAEQSSLLS